MKADDARLQHAKQRARDLLDDLGLRPREKQFAEREATALIQSCLGDKRAMKKIAAQRLRLTCVPVFFLPEFR